MDTRKPKILFIGYGHLAKSLITKELLSASNIYAVNSKKQLFDINKKKKLKLIKVEFKYVFILIPPLIFLEKGVEFKKFLTKNSIVISCMAGVKISSISQKLKTRKIIRIMPNILASKQKSQTYVYSKNIKLVDTKFKKILFSFGQIILVKKENQINLATAVFGSGPAFIAYLISTFIKASKNLSNPYKLDELEILKLFRNVLEINSSPNMLNKFINSITSKKGTTQAGIDYIKTQNFEKVMYTTLHKAYKRAKEIDN